MSDEPQHITKSGKVLTDADIEALAREAEMGYDPSTGDSIGKLLINTTDAAVWAHHFKDQFGDEAPDEATMTTWFANAIETGRSAGERTDFEHHRGMFAEMIHARQQRHREGPWWKFW